MNRMIYIAAVVRYLYGFFVFGLMCALFAPIAVPVALAPPWLQKYLEKPVRAVTHKSFAFVRWHCHVTGFATMRIIDHRRGRHSPLWIANHLSMFDIVLLFSFIPDIQTLVNAKFTQNPLLWPIIRASGYIPVNVEEAQSGARAFAELDASLNRGRTVVLFPEGTRSANGDLGPLKRGPFRLAREKNLRPDFVFFTCNQPFLNRAAFFPRLRGPVILEAHLYSAPDTPSESSRGWQLVFEEEYRRFRQSTAVLAWNRA